MTLKASSPVCFLSFALASLPVLGGDARPRVLRNSAPSSPCASRPAPAVADAAAVLSGGEREFCAAAFRLDPKDSLARVGRRLLATDLPP